MPLLEARTTSTLENILPSPLTLSVIIPTCNRKESLLRTLDSLVQQSFPMDRFEVIVVDDGSTDDTQTLASQHFPFVFRCVRQENQGSTTARNFGAKISQAETLVFIDDDVTISPSTLEALARTCCQFNKVLVMGTICKRSKANASVYTTIVLAMPDQVITVQDEIDVNFVDCNSELLACRRSDFFDLGMFQDPTAGKGWPNWDDVDLGYRAYLNGFRLMGSGKAMAEHWDYSISNRTMACQRLFRASRSAVWLFKKHPELQKLIPMLLDKTPPNWEQDSSQLLARKLARHIVSSRPVVLFMANLASILEQNCPWPVALTRLYTWLHGAHLFQGYRQGLRELKPDAAKA